MSWLTCVLHPEAGTTEDDGMLALLMIFLFFRLQVAAKYMPVSQLIIGIDLAPIKAIPNVITMINDITTDKCRTDLKRELKTWKADVFLNDGAPNVGSSWVHDAFTQAELVLSALKLATEFLVEGGTFVTKVFRSKDYNSLLWVFKQLFKTVEATKPASSRNVSAEIFVVCRGFLAPSHIDPKFLDPKHVFEELAGKSSASASGLNILRPEKKQRHRDGYEDGQMLVRKIIPVMDFIRNKDPVDILSTANILAFDSDKHALQLGADEDVRAYCEDLKVIGRKEFKALLKWRSGLRAKFIESREIEEEAVPLTEAQEEKAVEVDPLKELDDLAGLAQKLAKREKRKELEKKAKQRLRLQLQMENTGDLADDMQEEGLFSVRVLKRKAKMAAVMTGEEAEESEDEPVDDVISSGDNEEGVADSADEAARWEDEMEEHYQRFKEDRLQKDALRFVKEKREAGESDSDLDEDDSDAMLGSEYSSCPSSDEEADDAGMNVDIQTAAEKKAQLNSKANLFYSNPIFEVLEKANAGKQVKDNGRTKKRPVQEEDEVAPLLPEVQLSKKQKKEAKRQKQEKKAADKEEAKGIVFVKASPDFDQAEEDGEEQFDEKTKKMMMNPNAISLATQIVADRRRRKEDLVDGSFNRFAFGDSKGLPSWFTEDENRHNKPQVPISKEAAAMIKEKFKKMEAQPCKKVLEAKGRNKMRAMKRLDALKKKAAVIADSEEIGGRQKSEQIEKIMRGAKKQTKKEKKVVVAKGKLKGVKGRPKGVKGHYKMVDGRAKKDMRAKKSQSKKAKKAGKGRR